MGKAFNNFLVKENAQHILKITKHMIFHVIIHMTYLNKGITYAASLTNEKET